MKRALSVTVCLLVLVGTSARAQFRSQVPRETRVGSELANSGGSSFLFGWFSPENFQMRHSVGFSYVTFAGQSVSLGTYTNSMMCRFAENLDARADITLSYSPYSTFASKFGSAPEGLNGIHLSRAEINYRPWENVALQVQYRQLPFGGYYSPFYDAWYSPFGY